MHPICVYTLLRRLGRVIVPALRPRREVIVHRPTPREDPLLLISSFIKTLTRSPVVPRPFVATLFHFYTPLNHAALRRTSLDRRPRCFHHRNTPPRPRAQRRVDRRHHPETRHRMVYWRRRRGLLEGCHPATCPRGQYLPFL